MIIDIEGYTEPIFSKPIKQAEGETSMVIVLFIGNSANYFLL